jgi:hypothetical protein
MHTTRVYYDNGADDTRTVSGVAGATSADLFAAATADEGAPVACTACAANERCWASAIDIRRRMKGHCRRRKKGNGAK